jgi:hypothetical protein
MKISNFSRHILCGCVAAAMLAGCGGNAVSGATPPLIEPGKKLPFHKTFNYTGAEQIFTVPGGVRKLVVVAVGARGGGDPDYERRDIQSYGGRVWAIIPVTPGERLAIFVGGQGSLPGGGFNGGGSGAGAPSCCEGYGGGGGSDVRQGGDSIGDRVLVVGGGGGEESFSFPEYGGLGGNGGGSVGLTGTNGYSGGSSSGGYGGGGGTQHRGGAGGYGGGVSDHQYSGASGSRGRLAIGGSGGRGGGGVSYVGGGGGGGGGGYYGGGGGGGGGGYEGGPGGGGGGGSSHVESRAYAYRTWPGWKEIHTANGLVVVSWQ